MSGVYLPAEVACGCPYCLDPDSPQLREAVIARGRYRTQPLLTAALVEDLPLLRHLLEVACAGYDDLAGHPAFDVDTFFDSWRENLLHAGAEVSLEDGIVEPFRVMRRLVPNGHLDLAGYSDLISGDPMVTFAEYQALIEPHVTAAGNVEAPAGSRPDTLRTAPILPADGSVGQVLTVSAVGGHDHLTAGPVTLRRRDKQAPMAGPAYSWSSCGDTAVITITSLQWGRRSVREQLARFVADYPLHATHRRILFDLRGNGGGNLEPIRDWLRLARPDGWESWPMTEIMGEIAVSKPWNKTIEWQIREGTIDSDESREERARLASTWPDQAALPARFDKPSFRPGAGHGDPLAAAVYALVDRDSGSSGELAAIELQRAVGAVLIGERTAGCAELGQAWDFVLPATGLLIQIPTQWANLGRPLEGVGWPVDVYLEAVPWSPQQLLKRLPN